MSHHNNCPQYLSGQSPRVTTSTHPAAMQLTTSFLGTRFSKLQITAEPRANPNAQRMVTTMAKKKGVRCIVTLECTEARTEGATPSRYVTQKVRQPAKHIGAAVERCAATSHCLTGPSLAPTCPHRTGKTHRAAWSS